MHTDGYGSDALRLPRLDEAVLRAAESCGSRAGVCGKCGELAHYIVTGNSGLWVHSDTGSYRSRVPEPHDVNTHVIRAGADLLARLNGATS